MGLKPFGVSVLAPGTRVAETAGTKHQDKLKLLKLGDPGLFFFKGYCTKSTDCSRVWPKMGVSTWGLVEAQHEPDTGTAPQKFLGKCRYCRRVSSWKQSCDHTSAGQGSAAGGAAMPGAFLQPSLAPQIIPRQEKRQMEPQGMEKANAPTRRSPSPSAAGKHVCLLLS